MAAPPHIRQCYKLQYKGLCSDLANTTLFLPFLPADSTIFYCVWQRLGDQQPPPLYHQPIHQEEITDKVEVSTIQNDKLSSATSERYLVQTILHVLHFMYKCIFNQTVPPGHEIFILFYLYLYDSMDKCTVVVGTSPILTNDSMNNKKASILDMMQHLHSGQLDILCNQCSCSWRIHQGTEPHEYWP